MKRAPNRELRLPRDSLLEWVQPAASFSPIQSFCIVEGCADTIIIVTTIIAQAPTPAVSRIYL